MRPRAFFHAALLAAFCAAPAAAQLKDPGFTVAQVMNVPFTYGLVGAAKADRIAWLEAHQGRRNVYTAAAPDYTPVRLTANLEDDAVDLTGLEISQDGSVVAIAAVVRPVRRGRTQA